MNSNRLPFAVVAAFVLSGLGATPVAAAEQCYNLEPTIVGAPEGGVIEGTSGDDVILGLHGFDTINGNGGTDVICGGEGNDVIKTGAGDLGLAFGGPGDDKITVAAVGGYGGGDVGDDELWAEAEGVFLQGGENRDILNGSDHPDKLDGGAGDDDLWAHGGDDVDVKGGSGEDVISGGDGTDILHGDEDSDIVGSDAGSDDQVWGDAGDDDLFGEAPGAAVLGGDGDDVLTAEKKRILLQGGPDDDTLTGSKFADNMYGDEGNDTLDAGAGDDGSGQEKSISGGPGDDTVVGGEGRDEVYGDAGNDTVETGPGDSDFAFGGADHDTIRVQAPGGAGIGEDGHDTLSTKVKGVLLDGGPGDDVLKGGKHADRLAGEGGNDTVAAGGGADDVTGDGGIDGLEGGAGADVIKGGGGNDALNGQGGNDTLKGDGGTDHCSGGSGSDYCHGGSPGPEKPSPGDPDVCDGTVETKKSCRKPGVVVPKTYTGTSTGTLFRNWGNQDIDENWSASYTYELDEEASHEPSQYYVYELTQWNATWSAGGTVAAGACTIDAGPVEFVSPEPPINGYLILDLSQPQDTYSLWFQMNTDDGTEATQVCPPTQGGTTTVPWRARFGGLTEFLPLDLTKESIDGIVEDDLNDDDITWSYKLTPSKLPPRK